MPKPVKSQWDFGELFPPEHTQKVLSITELTQQIRRLLEQQIGQVWVSGEITNLRVQSSGHLYFTLKDSSAQLNCVLFRGEDLVDRALLEDGRKIVVCGDLTVYEPRGQYQLRVVAVQLRGIGALQIAFEKLKQKLNAEGLFAPERKRPLPRYPQRIGLVTSPTGAAIRDVLHVVERRNPALEITLVPCRVQGVGAALEIASAIDLLNEFNQSQAAPDWRPANISGAALRQKEGMRPLTLVTSYLDLILVTRGGGSPEDLWAFNEEVVARAIYKSVLPVVSAVGHEIDFTISDFVADLRAATPSAAAEIITEGVFSSCQFVAEAHGRIQQLLRQRLEDKAYVLAQVGQHLARLHPRRQLDRRLQRLDDLQSSLLRCVKQGARRQRDMWRNLADRLARVRPAILLNQRRELLHQETQRLHEAVQHRLEKCQSQISALADRLRLLGPEQVLARGYSITTQFETGKVLRAANEAPTGQLLKTRLKTGEIVSRVESPNSRTSNPSR
jgi:exodeoxyribonuclease VII large subunit